MPNVPKWEDTEEVTTSAPTWDDTEAVEVPSMLESAARGAAEGVTWGAAPYLTAAAESAAGSLGLVKDKTFDQALEESKKAYDEAAEANPVAYYGAEIGAGALTGGAAGKLALKAGKTALGKVATKAVPLMDRFEQATGTSVGEAVSGVAGAAVGDQLAGGIGAVVGGGLAGKVLGKAARKVSKSLMSRLGKVAAPAEKAAESTAKELVYTKAAAEPKLLIDAVDNIGKGASTGTVQAAKAGVEEVAQSATRVPTKLAQEMAEEARAAGKDISAETFQARLDRLNVSKKQKTRTEKGRDTTKRVLRHMLDEE